MAGKATVPFPQFDKPGSKISPYTGKPYTVGEAKQVHQNTLKADSGKREVAAGALQRRLGKLKDTSNVGAEKQKTTPLARLQRAKRLNEARNGTLGKQFGDDVRGAKNFITGKSDKKDALSRRVRKINEQNAGKTNRLN